MVVTAEKLMKVKSQLSLLCNGGTVKLPTTAP